MWKISASQKKDIQIFFLKHLIEHLPILLFVPFFYHHNCIHSKSWDPWEPDPADNLNFPQKDSLRTRGQNLLKKQPPSDYD